MSRLTALMDRRHSCGEEVVEGGVEEVRAEGAGLVQLHFPHAERKLVRHANFKIHV
jgi:hypothetical protein